MTLSSYRNTTCSRHDIVDKLLAWCLTTITHSLYVFAFEISMLLFYFVECKSSSITTPAPVIPGTESFRITSTDVLVTLQTKLDYEVNDYYQPVLNYHDKNSTNCAVPLQR
jgi:hypothetical protein